MKITILRSHVKGDHEETARLLFERGAYIYETNDKIMGNCCQL